MTQAVIRADATHTGGSGHVRRCLTLADALAREGWTVSLATVGESRTVVPELETTGIALLNMSGDAAKEPIELHDAKPSGTDLLVVDHYGRDIEFETSCRTWARRIAVLDDLADRSHDADLLLDMTLGRLPGDYADLLPDGALCLTGTRFALLRPEFAAARTEALAARRDRASLNDILVTVGAVDQSGIVPAVLSGLDRAGFTGTVDVVGQGVAADGDHPYTLRVVTHAQDMARRMAAADLAIGACGVTSWERCCLGLPTLAIITAENQRQIANALDAAGAARLVDPATPGAIAKAVSQLLKDPGRLRRMSAAAADVCDGRGAERAADAFNALARDRDPAQSAGATA